MEEGAPGARTAAAYCARGYLLSRSVTTWSATWKFGSRTQASPCHATCWSPASMMSIVSCPWRCQLVSPVDPEIGRFLAAPS